jgi:hypothetical protein
MSYTWIHPPVGNFSTPKAIQAWLDTLNSWEQDPQRDEAIVEAERWLEHAIALEKRLNKQPGA